VDRDAFREALLQIMERKVHWAWPHFGSGRVPKQLLHHHFEQEYATYVRDFPVMVGWAYVQCPIAEVRRDLAENNPDLVQRFVDASIIGWYNYLYGDNKAANELIRKHNPEMSQELIDYSIAKMKEYGIVDSGDTLKGGIGAMTDARMKGFFDQMVASGVVKGGIDYKKAYSLQFVNKGVGVDLRK
jgi:hypothetical protein